MRHWGPEAGTGQGHMLTSSLPPHPSLGTAALTALACLWNLLSRCGSLLPVITPETLLRPQGALEVPQLEASLRPEWFMGHLQPEAWLGPWVALEVPQLEARKGPF